MGKQKNFKYDFLTPFEENFIFVIEDLKNKPNVKILEIGTFEGLSTLWFCEHCLTGENSSITTIDIQPQPSFYENTEQERQSGKIKSVLGKSFDVLHELLNTDEKFDLIYIDGSHLGMHVLEDAMLCWRLLKNNGILFFDDYMWDDPVLYNSLLKTDYESLSEDYDFSLGNPFVPKIAIEAFLGVYNLQYDLLFINYQLAIRKTNAFVEKNAKGNLFGFN